MTEITDGKGNFEKPRFPQNSRIDHLCKERADNTADKLVALEVVEVVEDGVNVVTVGET